MPTDTITQYPPRTRTRGRHCRLTDSTAPALRETKDVPGAPSEHTKGAHKAPRFALDAYRHALAKSRLFTWFPNNPNSTHASAGAPDTWHFQDGLLRPSAAGARRGVHDAEERCMEMRREVLLPAGPGGVGRMAPAPVWAPEAATLVQGLERRKAGIPIAARTMGRDEEALP